MITVNILISGRAIYARTAVNRLRETGYYIGDGGQKIAHNPDDGAIELAIKMLRTIHEDPDELIGGWNNVSSNGSEELDKELERIVNKAIVHDGRENNPLSVDEEAVRSIKQAIPGYHFVGNQFVIDKEVIAALASRNTGRPVGKSIETVDSSTITALQELFPESTVTVREDCIIIGTNTKLVPYSEKKKQ